MSRGGSDAKHKFDLKDEVLIVLENEGVPEYVFPIRHIVATEME